MENCVQAMMWLIANEVCGAALNPADCAFEEDDLIRLYRLSKAHDLAHLVGDALIRNRLLSDSEVKAKFEKQMMTAGAKRATMHFCTMSILCLNALSISNAPKIQKITTSASKNAM